MTDPLLPSAARAEQGERSRPAGRQRRRRWLVVGAGSAGCVVAARMSADPSIDVTLLEAGPWPAGPGAAAVRSTDFFEALESEHVWPDLVAHGPSRSAPYRRGFGVGGSSLVNALVALEPATLPVPLPAAVPPHRIPVDFAADDQLGAVDRAVLAASPLAARAPLSIRDGQRVSAAAAYLDPVRDRPSLTIRPGTEVRRVLFDRRGARPRAVGVETIGGEQIEADVVVLCAGAIHSPTILLRSNVGPDVVGLGLTDHPSVPITLDMVAEAQAPTAGGFATAVLVSHLDLQLLPMNHLGGPGAESRRYGLLMPALMQPRGVRGRVSLDSDHPDGPPHIRLDLTADDRDVGRLATAVELARELLAAPSMCAIVTEAYVDAHGTTLESLVTADDVERWVRTAAGDYVHAASTCAIGRVVDTTGAVYDHDGLFVCDASLFPMVPEVNTHLPTTMLAEALCAWWTG